MRVVQSSGYCSEPPTVPNARHNAPQEQSSFAPDTELQYQCCKSLSLSFSLLLHSSSYFFSFLFLLFLVQILNNTISFFTKKIWATILLASPVPGVSSTTKRSNGSVRTSHAKVITSSYFLPSRKATSLYCLEIVVL